MLSAVCLPSVRQLFHQVAHELLGHSFSYAQFTAPTAGGGGGGDGDGDALPSAVQLHAALGALRAWTRLQLSRALPADPSATAAAAEAERVAQVDAARAELAQQGCSDAAASPLLSAYLARESELRAWARAQSVAQLSEWALRDFDWSARVTLASSALANVREPTLLLSLLLAAPAPSAAAAGAAVAGAAPTRKLALELNQTELDRVLAQMEKINQVVQQYSTNTDEAAAGAVPIL